MKCHLCNKEMERLQYSVFEICKCKQSQKTGEGERRMNRQGLITMKIREAEHNRLAVFKTANGYKSYTEAIRALLNRLC